MHPVDPIDNTEKLIENKINMDNVNVDCIDFDGIRIDMVQYICNENKAFFRSQQINEPEITVQERKEIIEKILNESDKKFLLRFGKFIQIKHLKYFQRNVTDNDDNLLNTVEDKCELNMLIKSIETSLMNRMNMVKNRRFVAMQKMIEENNSYFSEREMMRREPLLYEHLIGQYMTNTERLLRDNNTDSNDGVMGFSDILLDGIDKEQIEQLRKQQENAEQKLDNNEEFDSDDDDNSINLANRNVHKDNIIDDNYFPQMPPSFKKHWGDFNENECSGNSSAAISQNNNEKQSVKIKSQDIQQYITANEKDLLKDEFIGIMHSKFLMGNDLDFDYATVDDNNEYDSIDLINQDAEDKYFNDGDDDDDDDDDPPQMEINSNHHAPEVSSEDELDIYMKKLEDGLIK